jgi:type VII secretion-associated serine protease mycosin
VTRRTAGRLASTAAAVVLTLATVTAPTPAAAQASDWWQSLWRLDEVWRLSEGEGVVVAVIDSGVEEVPELAGAVLPGTDLSGNAPDARTDHDPDAHGTRMALLIAGRGTVTGLRGVAPAATILPLTYTSAPAIPSDEAFADSILSAVEQGAHVINISMASPGECGPYLSEAVRYAISRGAIVVAASGNHPVGSPDLPGSCPGVITVGAIGPQLEPWHYSLRSEHVDVAAPGAELPVPHVDGRIVVVSGTSDATAMVSGTLALLRAAYPDASAYDLVTRLIATTRDLGEPGRDDATGYGLVQPLDALTATVPDDTPNPVYDPLGDLTNVPSPTSPSEPRPSAPNFAPPPPVGGAGTGTGDDTLPVALLAVGAALLTAAVVALVLVIRRRPTGRHTA